MDSYNTARIIFFNAQVGAKYVYELEQGIKIRAALYVIINRNPNTRKQFKSRKTKQGIEIWRRL